MYVKVTKYDQFSSQSVAILKKIRKLGKKDSVSELVFPTRRGSVKAEEVNMMGGSELKLHEFKGGVGEGEGGLCRSRPVHHHAWHVEKTAACSPAVSGRHTYSRRREFSSMSLSKAICQHIHLSRIPQFLYNFSVNGGYYSDYYTVCNYFYLLAIFTWQYFNNRHLDVVRLNVSSET